jgi:hypothetical protein
MHGGQGISGDRRGHSHLAVGYLIGSIADIISWRMEKPVPGWLGF